jgi:hypothetical protein
MVGAGLEEPLSVAARRMAQSRRHLLQLLSVAWVPSHTLADVTVLSTAQSQQSDPVWHKFSKQIAGYVEHGRGGPETCGMCHYFLDPDQCVLVEGPVNPATGWCNYGVTTG